MPCGVRAAQGKVAAVGLASSEVRSNSRSLRFPVTLPQLLLGQAAAGAGTEPVAAGQRKTGMAGAGIAVSGAGQPRHSRPLRTRTQSRRPRPGRRSVR
jgi:hypothetical protein